MRARHSFRSGILTLLLLAACARGDESGAANDLGAPGTTQSRDAVYERLQEFGSIGLNANRDDSLHPENVLSQLHGFLTEGKGLKRKEIDGHQTLVLKKLPDSVFQQIMAVAFPDTYKSGFEILQASFWQEVRNAQKEGITIGFLEPDPSFNVSGVFYEKYGWDKNLIFVDVFAGQGTLMHEHRHYEQSRFRKAREDARAWDDNGPATLDEKCLEQMSYFLGELDATTIEEKNWIGVFQTLDVTPAWHKYAIRGAVDPVRFPQIFMLVTNLDYPGRAAAQVLAGSCPKEVIDAVTKIKTSTDDFEERITDGDTDKLFTLRMEDFHAWTYLNSSCSATPPPEACGERQVRIAAIPIDAQIVKSSIDSLFTAEIADRPVRIRADFAPLPDEVQEDLCEYASSYELLVDCKPYDAKRKANAHEGR